MFSVIETVFVKKESQWKKWFFLYFLTRSYRSRSRVQNGKPEATCDMLGVEGGCPEGQDKHDDGVELEHEVSQPIVQFLVGGKQLVRAPEIFVNVLKC